MKTNRFFIAIGLLICLLATPATLNAADAKPQVQHAQVIKIKSHVFTIRVIGEDGQPIIGATVQVYPDSHSSSYVAVATDIDGYAHFSTNSQNPYIVISYVTHKTVKMQISGSTEILIVMQEYTELLD